MNEVVSEVEVLMKLSNKIFLSSKLRRKQTSFLRLPPCFSPLKNQQFVRLILKKDLIDPMSFILQLFRWKWKPMLIFGLSKKRWKLHPLLGHWCRHKIKIIWELMGKFFW
jgi:hypothetical protein